VSTLARNKRAAIRKLVTTNAPECRGRGPDAVIWRARDHWPYLTITSRAMLM
jgi:hypothetical protein